MMVSLVQWFRRVVGLPLGIEEPEEGAPLTGLAQEAAMLVAAFEGVDPNAQHASHEFSVWQVAEVLSDHVVFVADGEGNDGLAANERDRWVRDGA